MGLYRVLTDLGAPGIALYLRWRRLRGKEDPNRLSERYGHASLERLPGPLVWCHAVSVGEAVSVLSLVEALDRYFKDWQVLVTTGTVTSAGLMAARLPRSVIHQYVPVDRWPYVSRFLDHWHPDLALWVESELWPNALEALRLRNIPAVLLNGRMSAKSFKRWSFLRKWAQSMLAAFHLICAQTEAEKERFTALGAKNVVCAGNLKYAAEPLPCDAQELDRLRVQIGARPVWLMASTHEGEDEIALDVHAHLRTIWPNVLTIIVPRHPVRGEAILKKAVKRGLLGARRSLDSNIARTTAVYVADTMGEMGLFYRLVPLACVGGSFVWGGHNPVEPAQLGCAMLFGPMMTNFADMAEDLLAHGGAVQVHSPNELAVRIEQLMSAPRDVFAMADAARSFVEQKRGVLNVVLGLLSPYLERSKGRQHESA